jgi:hypothetical protein
MLELVAREGGRSWRLVNDTPDTLLGGQARKEWGRLRYVTGVVGCLMVLALTRATTGYRSEPGSSWRLFL